MLRRPKVLVFVPWYLPASAGGGSMRSVVATVQALREEFVFSIVTSDRDLGADTPYPGVRRDAWNTLSDDTRVFYSSRSGRTAMTFARLIRDESPDIVYVNGVFSYSFAVLPLLAARGVRPRPKVLLAPRGMLEPVALQQKPWKKRVFLRVMSLSRLYTNITWHVSSLNEAGAIHSAFGAGARIEIAMDLSRPDSLGFVPREKRSGAVRLFFLSRIVPNKNLLGAIRMMKGVGAAYRAHLDVYGPSEDPTYWARCCDEMRTLPDHVTITYHGAIEHSAIVERLASAHFLLLPTRFENFGHVILESLAMCCPVNHLRPNPVEGARAATTRLGPLAFKSGSVRQSHRGGSDDGRRDVPKGGRRQHMRSLSVM